jgi:hypothetical protein
MMLMDAKQRSAADLFADKVQLLNQALNDASLVTLTDLIYWDAVIDDLTKLAEVDYVSCDTDEKKMSVIAILTAALLLRARLRGITSTPLSDLNDFLINGALRKPTLLQLPTKKPGATKPINEDQAEVYYAVLYAHFPDQKNVLNAAARKRFDLNDRELSRKRYDLTRQRAKDRSLERMFNLAEADVSDRKSCKLSDYI